MDNQDFKELDKEILLKIYEDLKCCDEDADDWSIEVDDKKYSLCKMNESQWSDDGRGKYFFNEVLYGLALYDNDWHIVEKYNIMVEQSQTRTGSYYTDWDYSYDTPILKEQYEKVIPEQIIPEHTVIDYKEIKL